VATRNLPASQRSAGCAGGTGGCGGVAGYAQIDGREPDRLIDAAMALARAASACRRWCRSTANPPAAADRAIVRGLAQPQFSYP